MTLSNRITLAGALPLLVAFALAVLVAAIALAPSKPTSATGSSDLCGLSPVLLDMLIERHGSNAQGCDTLTFGDGIAEDFDEAIWDLSGNDDRSLTEFAISDDDADILKVFNSESLAGVEIVDGPVIAAAVDYIDLTGNPLTIDDVNFKHIPSTVGVILSADSNVNGFQASEYTVTEGTASYVAVAFPDLTFTNEALPLAPTFTISGRDATAMFGPGDRPFASGTHRQLIKFGEGTPDEVERDALVNSVSDSRIFYLPLTVDKDNDNSDEWDFSISIGATIGNNDTTDYDLANDEIDITVLDADAPATSVCDRSEGR